MAGGHHRELVGGFEVEGALGREITGIEAGAAVGFVDSDRLAQLLATAGRPPAADERADAIWIEDCVGSVAGGTGSASTAVTIPLRGPQPGRYFEITSIVVLGSDDHTAVANTAVVFCIGSPATPTVTDCRLPGTSTLPASYEGGPHALIVTNPHKPYVKIYGLGATQPAVAIVNGWDRPVWADSERSLMGPLALPPTRTNTTRDHQARYADGDGRPVHAGQSYDPPDLPTAASSWPPAGSRRRG